MEKVYLSLGSNLNDREDMLKKAQCLLKQSGVFCQKASQVYESEPWGFTSDTDFLNQILQVETSLEPIDLLQKIKAIEKELGRKQNNSEEYESRPIDIDIILFGNHVIHLAELTVPHPLAHKRRFILVPMSELDSTFVHPVFGKTIQQLLDECTNQSQLRILN